MSKAVLLSIQPKWCELIANGKKTVEVRKTKPKLPTPFKCYIYCTKDKWKHIVQMPDKTYRIYNGKEYRGYDKLLCFEGESNGKVIGEFVCDDIEPIPYQPSAYCRLRQEKESCLTSDEIAVYLRNKDGYSQDGFGWHISNLVIYDNPKEPNCFLKYNRTGCYYSDLGLAKRGCFDCDNPSCHITIPPQSWCYVECLEDNQ